MVEEKAKLRVFPTLGAEAKVSARVTLVPEPDVDPEPDVVPEPEVVLVLEVGTVIPIALPNEV